MALQDTFENFNQEVIDCTKKMQSHYTNHSRIISEFEECSSNYFLNNFKQLTKLTEKLQRVVKDGQVTVSLFTVEQFSIEWRKTQIKVKASANHKRLRRYSQPNQM